MLRAANEKTGVVRPSSAKNVTRSFIARRFCCATASSSPGVPSGFTVRTS
jgi:hypothetical protein